jgi:hypothetical protein
MHWKAPDHVEFGHVSEGPDDWEQRFEKKQGHRHQGKVNFIDLIDLCISGMEHEA